MDTFPLHGREFVELKNLLKLAGLCESGGQAKAAIAEGRVTVDGVVEQRKGRKVRAGSVVEFDGARIVVQMDTILFQNRGSGPQI